MYNHLPKKGFQTAALVSSAFLLLVYGCTTSDRAVSPGDQAIQRLFSEPVSIHPLPLKHSEFEASDHKLVRISNAAGHTVGYAAEVTVVSRSGPFPILVMLDTKRCIRQVRVLHYTARRGRGVQADWFAEQFNGKCPGDAFTIGTDINSVTGATLSSQAVTDGVKKALRLTAKVTDD